MAQAKALGLAYIKKYSNRGTGWIDIQVEKSSKDTMMELLGFEKRPILLRLRIKTEKRN